MHLTLALLAAAGQLVVAFDPHVTHLPRAANQEDNLATITALSDGHLPTCFTGHPTYPCPTNGPEAKRDLMGDLAGNPMDGLPGGLNEAARIVPIEQIGLTAPTSLSKPTDAPKARKGPRDAKMEAWDKNYIPHPSEWAIPGSFKFTDSIDHNSTGTTMSAANLTTSSIEKYHVAPTAVSPQPNEHYNNHYAHHHGVYHNSHNSNAYVHTSAASESVTAKAHSQTTDPPVLPSTSHKQHDAANSSSEAHVAGSIGTLLSGAMFPGTMRAPSTTNTSPYSAAVTSHQGESKVVNKPDTYSTTQVHEASISTPCADSDTSSSSTAPMYGVKPVTMSTLSRPVALSEAQATASYKPAQLQHSARHFVS